MIEINVFGKQDLDDIPIFHVCYGAMGSCDRQMGRTQRVNGRQNQKVPKVLFNGV